MKWALIGASDIAASQMVPAMRMAGHEPCGVVSSSPDRARSYALTHGLARSTSCLEEVADWGVDAVYISTTNDRHAQQSVWASTVGLHVLAEKPLAMSIGEATAMIAEAHASGTLLATNHHLRASTVLVRAKEMLTAGELGLLRAIRVNFAGSLPERLRGWRVTDPATGAGVVFDLTVHNADTIRFLTGQEIEAVVAVARAQEFTQPGIMDTSFCFFELTGGAVATTFESFSAPGSVSSVEVHGSEASLYLSDVLTQEQRGTCVLRRDGVESRVDVTQSVNVYVATIEAFASAVKGSGQPLCSGEDGRASLAAALAALRSAAEGRRVPLATLTPVGNA